MQLELSSGENERQKSLFREVWHFFFSVCWQRERKRGKEGTSGANLFWEMTNFVWEKVEGEETERLKEKKKNEGDFFLSPVEKEEERALEKGGGMGIQ